MHGKRTVQKPAVFLGSSLVRLKKFPESVISQIGYEIHRLQCGANPTSYKPMKQIGTGVCEIRVAEEKSWFRILYVTSFKEAVYILHAFEKKRNSTSKKDIEVGKKAFAELLQSRKQRVRNG